MEPFIGQIVMFGGNFAPRGWALCDGQLLAVNSYSALFSILGTTYGGDGRTTFGLPDLRGRVPMHAGNGPGLSDRRLGAKAGTEDVTLTVNQMPSHNHSVASVGSSDQADSTDPTGRKPAVTPEDAYAAAGTEVATGAVTESNVGGSQSHTNVQPFQCVNFIIALQGTYPSRS